MKSTRTIMGMPITVEVVDAAADADDLEKIFTYFKNVDEKFSTYKEDSEISKINKGFLALEESSEDMRKVFLLAEETKKDTDGYFNIKTPKGVYDPSGLVKGWAINNAAISLRDAGFKNFYVEAGGDVQTYGKNSKDEKWSVGIKNPFNQTEIVKVVYLSGQGIATSGNYIRGQHIYNPHAKNSIIDDIVSLSVIGPNIYEADRFATAAFAMGKEGINFIQRQKGLEGYMIDSSGMGTETGGFGEFVVDSL